MSEMEIFIYEDYILNTKKKYSQFICFHSNCIYEEKEKKKKKSVVKFDPLVTESTYRTGLPSTVQIYLQEEM